MSLLINPYAFTSTLARVAAPLTWVEYEPGSQADLTTTGTTPVNADATNLSVTFTAPASGQVLVIINALWLGVSGFSSGEISVSLHDGTTTVAGSTASVLSGNRRMRWEYRNIFSVTPSQSYTWKLRIASNGTHATGLRVGPANSALMMVYDTGNSIIPNLIGYQEQESPGGSIETALGTTTMQQFIMEGAQGPVALPSFSVPASGSVMVVMHVTVVTATSASVDTALGLWDTDVVAESGTATSGATTTITDTSKSWTTNQWATYSVAITGGTGAGQTRQVLSNTATVLTISSSAAVWSPTPASGSTYQIKGAEVANSAQNFGAGESNMRNHTHYRKVITGLTPGAVKNWSVGCRLLSAGSNVIVFKLGVDATEGPMVMQIWGLDT